MFQYRNMGVLGGAIAIVLVSQPASAWALQSLDVFIHGAAIHNTDVMEARANRDQQDALALAALGHILPGLGAKGTYTRNEYEVVFAFPTGAKTPPVSLTIQPYNQLDATLSVSVPLVDIASYVRYGAARSLAESGAQQEAAVALRVESIVTQYYYQLVANVALVNAAQQALEVAKASLQLTRDRLHAGRAAPLDEARAAAEVERQQQQLTLAEYQVSVTARALETLSGITPDAASSPPLRDDLAPEESVEKFAGTDDGRLSALRTAVLACESLERQALAQKLSLIPALNGAFTERLTNATGFSAGHNHFYLATLNLVWNFDLATVGNIQAAEAAAAAGQARELRARLAARDDIENTWNMVQSSIARSRSARAQAKASADAAVWAKDRYSAGVATQLDLLMAERDAFMAEASRIQADADLVNARAQLRYVSGIRFDAFFEEKKP